MESVLKWMKPYNYLNQIYVRASSVFLTLFLPLLFIFDGCYSLAYSAIFVLPEKGDIIGHIQYAHSQIGETIDEVGRRYHVGYNEMVRANPSVSANHPLAANTLLVIPTQYILPPGSRSGLVINLAQYRLYYFSKDENIVYSFPIGIGKVGWDTPVGLTKIKAKVANPIWRPTARLREAAEKITDPLPDVFPPGPNNPLGAYALYLGWPSFLIHGTNRMDGIGSRVSAGCIRMLPEDIEQLYSLVSVGTSVRVLNESVLIGKQNGKLFFQLYPLLKESKKHSLMSELKIKLNYLPADAIMALSHETVNPSGLIQPITS